MNDNDGVDARLQQLYQQLPKAQPNSTVDAHILAAAKLKKNWHQPFALAATLVLTTSLIWYWKAEQPQQLEQAMSSAPMAKAIEPRVIAIETFNKEDTLTVKPEAQEEANKRIAPTPPNISDTAENKAKASELKVKRESAPILNEQVAQLADMAAPSAPSPMIPEPIKQQDAAIELQAAAKERSVLAKRHANTQEVVAAKKNLLQTARQEDVRRIFLQQWPNLDAIFQQTLQNDPAMEGQLRLRLSIDSHGKVTSCEVILSELNNSVFEAKIMALIKSFDFGEGAAWQGDYTLVFYP